MSSQADRVLAIISDEPSRWVLEEIREAQKQDVALMPILVGTSAVVPDWLRNTEALAITGSFDAKQAVQRIGEQLTKLNL